MYEVSEMARLVTVYLGENPLACDTLDGIARWSLSSRERVDLIGLAASLAGLERAGVVQTLHGPDGRVRFRLKASPGD